MTSASSSPRAARSLSLLVRVYWMAYFAAQLALAKFLKIDYYDAFVYLRCARRLAGAHLGFSPDRPPLLPLLHTPLQVLLNLASAATAARMWAPHVFESLLSGACLVAVYCFLRRSLSPGWAQLGAIVFSLNRLTVHYFTSILPDLTATLLLLLVFIFEDAADKTGQAAPEALAAAAMTGCLLCRWNMLLLPAGLALRAFWPWSPVRLKRIARLSGVSVILAAAVMVFLYKALHPMSLPTALGSWAGFLKEQFFANAAPEPLDAYVHTIVVSFGILPVLALLYGLTSGPGGLADGKFAAAFLIFYLAAMTLGVGHKESRYILPAAPLLCLFVVQGLKRACEKAPRVPRAAIVGAALVACGLTAATEFDRFLDPVFRGATLLDCVDALAQKAASARTLYWDGLSRAFSPEARFFAPGDPNFYFYHAPNKDCAEYFVGRPFVTLADGPAPAPGDVLARAPRRFSTIVEPLSPEENRIVLLVYDRARRWEPMGRF